MDMPVVIGVTLFVVIGGLIAARLWWNLASKGAPYKDEEDRARGPGSAGDDAEVVRWNAAQGMAIGAAAGMMAAGHQDSPAANKPDEGADGHRGHAGSHRDDTSSGGGDADVSRWEDSPAATGDYGSSSGGMDSGTSGGFDSGGSSSFDSGGSFDSGSSSSSSDI